MAKNQSKELKILKIILWSYIILCIVIAGVKYGYASKATPEVNAIVTNVWHFYENWVKTIFIIVCSILTLRIVKKSKRTIMRKRNLIGLIITALIVHIIVPLLLGNSELYLFAMPLPWTTKPLQLLSPNTTFYQSKYAIWGTAGISAILIFYVCVSIIVLIGTLLFGRRWQCSTICLFNGFASEIFAPVIPLIGKNTATCQSDVCTNKKLSSKTLMIFNILRWVFLAIAIFFTVLCILFLAGVSLPVNFDIISNIELFKYLCTELLVAMFFWVALTQRGYCYYCPLGTVLAFISKFAGQKITTANSKCIQCNQCNMSCPMSIDIKSLAAAGKDVKEMRCVGCGHCVDACPTKTLAYSTRFIQRFIVSNKRKNRTNSLDL